MYDEEWGESTVICMQCVSELPDVFLDTDEAIKSR